jgi:hypothetical protein
MREEKRLVCSRSVNMHVRWSSLIRSTTRDSAALLPDLLRHGSM